LVKSAFEQSMERCEQITATEVIRIMRDYGIIPLIMTKQEFSNMCEVLHATVIKQTRMSTGISGLGAARDRKDANANMNIFDFEQFM